MDHNNTEPHPARQALAITAVQNLLQASGKAAIAVAMPSATGKQLLLAGDIGSLAKLLELQGIALPGAPLPSTAHRAHPRYVEWFTSRAAEQSGISFHDWLAKQPNLAGIVLNDADQVDSEGGHHD